MRFTKGPLVREFGSLAQRQMSEQTITCIKATVSGLFFGHDSVGSRCLHSFGFIVTFFGRADN